MRQSVDLCTAARGKPQRYLACAASAVAFGACLLPPIARAGTLEPLHRLTPTGLQFAGQSADGRYAAFAEGSPGGRVEVRDTMRHEQSMVPIVPGCFFVAIGGGRLAYDCGADPAAPGYGRFVVTDLTGGDLHSGDYPGSNISMAYLSGVGATWLLILPGTDKLSGWYVNWRTMERRDDQGTRDLDSLTLAPAEPAGTPPRLLPGPGVKLTHRPLRVIDRSRTITLSTCSTTCHNPQVYGRRVTWTERGRRRVRSLNTGLTVVVKPATLHPFVFMTGYELILQNGRRNPTFDYARLPR